MTNIATRINVLRDSMTTYVSYALRLVSATLSMCRVLPTLELHRGSPNQMVALQVVSFDKGGLEEVVLMLARNLQKHGHLKIVVFVEGNLIGDLGMLARQFGIPVIALNGNRIFLRMLIRLLNVAVVNLHYSTFGVEEYAQADVPMVYTIHNTYIWADPWFVQSKTNEYQFVSKFLAVSRAVKDFFVARFRIDPDLVVTVPNGLDLEYVAVEEPVTRESLGFSQDDMVFLNVASFNWNKFQILLIAAMEKLIRRCPQAKLLIVGNSHGPECRRYVESEIERRGLGAQVRILDYVPKGKVIGLMRMADCFVLPSLIEGWSIAIMEAMYCELPLILSDVGSARDVIKESDIGIVIRNPYEDIGQLTPELISERYANSDHLDNVSDLVSAMATIAAERDAWKEKARQARRKIEQQFTARHMCQQYEECFTELIARRKTRA